MVFSDPKSDIAFKKLFGNSEHKDIVISFLNSVLERKEGHKIVEVVINDPNNMPETRDDKTSIVDVRCSDQSGVQYIVEMQVVKQHDYLARCQYYAAKALSIQLHKKQKYKKIVPVIFIGVVDFELLPSKSFISHHLILDKETHEHSLHYLEFHFIELGKFHKNLADLSTVLEKWIYLLKNADSLDSVPNKLQKPSEIQEAFEILEQSSWTKKELEVYERYLDGIRSRESQLETAYEDGEIKGEMKAKEIIAKTALLKGTLTLEEIAELTQLSINKIKKLKNDL